MPREHRHGIAFLHCCSDCSEHLPHCLLVGPKAKVLSACPADELQQSNSIWSHGPARLNAERQELCMMVRCCRLVLAVFVLLRVHGHPADSLSDVARCQWV